MPQSVIIATSEKFQPSIQVGSRRHLNLAELPTYKLPACPTAIRRLLPVVMNIVVGALNKKFEPPVGVTAYRRSGGRLAAQRLPLASSALAVAKTKTHSVFFPYESLQNTQLLTNTSTQSFRTYLF